MKRIQSQVEMFNEPGDFKSLWAAQGWLKKNGYSYGSTCVPHKEVAVRKGDYDLPQKWMNMSKKERESVDGVIVSNDFRNGPVTVIIYGQKQTI